MKFREMPVVGPVDPTATLQVIQQTDSVARGVGGCENLHQWLCSGGCEPNWRKWPKGTAAFVRWRNRHSITNPPPPSIEPL